MAGLSAAWQLSREGYRVTVFEKGSNPGLSAHSRDFSDFVPGLDGELIGDVPSRMLNASLWPGVTRLYENAGIKIEPVDHKQTFFNDQGELRLKIGLPYDATAMLKLVLNPIARKILLDLRSFQSIGIQALKDGGVDGITFGEFVESTSKRISSSSFFDDFLFPALTSTVFTCPSNDLLEYPSRVVLDALEKITNNRDPLMRTIHGSKDAANKLLIGVENFLCNTRVDSVLERGETIIVHADGKAHEFDQVIVATQANHASKLVSSEYPKASKLLAKFRYVDVPVVIHTDVMAMPAHKKDWGTFNFQSGQDRESTCTVWMNQFHSRWPDAPNLFHSIFPRDGIDSSQIVAFAKLQRPVVDSSTDSLHGELDRIHSQRRRVWFVGSYAARGVPLLESAVQSSHAVVERIASQLVKASF